MKYHCVGHNVIIMKVKLDNTHNAFGMAPGTECVFSCFLLILSLLLLVLLLEKSGK